MPQVLFQAESVLLLSNVTPLRSVRTEVKGHIYAKVVKQQLLSLLIKNLPLAHVKFWRH